MIFFFLSGTRALFEVSLNGYIFQQSRERSVTLASQKQSLMAITGIGATFVGASAMEVVAPSLSMSVSSVFALVMSCVWLYWQSRNTSEPAQPQTQ